LERLREDRRRYFVDAQMWKKAAEQAEAERDELQRWKSEQQRFLIAAAVTLLNAGYKGDGVEEGIEWLAADRDRLKAALASAETPYPNSDRGVMELVGVLVTADRATRLGIIRGIQAAAFRAGLTRQPEDTPPRCTCVEYVSDPHPPYPIPPCPKHGGQPEDA
jgi:hypothetical protein